MEYRGKYYDVFQTLGSKTWTWAIDLDPHTIESGQAASEATAIRAAERLIDKSFLPRKQKLAGVLLKFPRKR
jgi:hypothetical protein